VLSATGTNEVVLCVSVLVRCEISRAEVVYVCVAMCVLTSYRASSNLVGDNTVITFDLFGKQRWDGRCRTSEGSSLDTPIDAGTREHTQGLSLNERIQLPVYRQGEPLTIASCDSPRPKM
jgi:hypothetical protein